MKKNVDKIGVQFSPNGSELQFSKILIHLNRELELTTPARTGTRTGTELSVQFCQFGPNRRFRTELWQHYLNPISIPSSDSLEQIWGIVLSQHLWWVFGLLHITPLSPPFTCICNEIRFESLASLDGIKELLKYVGRTARFKTTLGSALGDVSHLESEEG